MNAGLHRMGAAALAMLVVAAGVAACGSSPSGSPTVDLKAQQARYKHELAAAPKPLAGLVDQQNQLLEGDQAAFEARLAELRGYPVVVNKWASWCGPCRSEFPYFQSLAAKLGDHIGFVGVDSQDNDDAARTFLGEYPVPYPSYADPDLKIADSLGVQVEFPSTIFVDSSGNVVHVSRGGYASEDDLAADIERYAN